MFGFYSVVTERRLFAFFVQNAHCRIEDSGIIERHDTTVGTLLEMYTDAALCIEVATAEIVANGLDVDTQFICDAL